jgi:cytosine/adenosine deaminase-related metal-dependent hydrolase
VDWIARHGRYGVGTDSNVCGDAAQELRQLEYAQRLGQRGRNLMAGRPGASTGRALFTAVLEGGAAALQAGLPGLRTGAAADLVTLRADHPSLVHRHGDPLLDGWIFGGGEAVDCVWTRGRKQVADGRHVARETVAARYAEALRRLLVS